MLIQDEVLAVEDRDGEPAGRHPAGEVPGGVAIAELGTVRVDGAATLGRRARRGLHLKRFILSALAGFLLLAGSRLAWHWWSSQCFIEATDDAYVQSDISVVSSKVQGYVREVAVADNQPVKAGDVLVTISDADFVTKVVEGLARVEAQRAAIGGVSSRIRRQRAVVDEAAATLAGAEAEQQRAVQDLRRYQVLAGKDVVSRQRLETIQADAQKADAAVQKARAALAAERNELAVIEAQHAESEAILSGAEAALETARIDLASTLIRAPVDGVIGNRGVQVGALVKPGTPLLSVVPLETVYVVANFKETQLPRMRPGQRVELDIDAFPGHRIEGRVESFSPATGSLFSLLPPENATGNFTKIVQRLPVKIALSAGDGLVGQLRPGLSVVAAVDTRAEGERPPSLGDLPGLVLAALTSGRR